MRSFALYLGIVATLLWRALAYSGRALLDFVTCGGPRR